MVIWRHHALWRMELSFLRIKMEALFLVKITKVTSSCKSIITGFCHNMLIWTARYNDSDLHIFDEFCSPSSCKQRAPTYFHGYMTPTFFRRNEYTIFYMVNEKSTFFIKNKESYHHRKRSLLVHGKMCLYNTPVDRKYSVQRWPILYHDTSGKQNKNIFQDHQTSFFLLKKLLCSLKMKSPVLVKNLEWRKHRKCHHHRYLAVPSVEGISLTTSKQYRHDIEQLMCFNIHRRDRCSKIIWTISLSKTCIVHDLQKVRVLLSRIITIT